MSFLRVLMVALVVGVQPAAVSAHLGGSAARGDNCTPFNSFKIGYGIPGGTIVSQKIVVVKRVSVAGWILDTASGRRYYVPNPSFFDHAIEDYGPAAPPAFVAMDADGSAALERAYRKARELRKEYSHHVERDSPRQLPSATLIAPCFANPLRT